MAAHQEDLGESATDHSDSSLDERRRKLLKQAAGLLGVLVASAVETKDAYADLECKCNRQSGCTCVGHIKCVCVGNTACPKLGK
jgi:hypothetical protein